MRKEKLVLAAAVAGGAVVTVGTVALAIHRYRKARRNRHKFMPQDTREGMERILCLQASEFVPDGLGSALAERKLAYMSDPQLLGLYALTKVVKVMRTRGVDLENPSKEVVEQGIQEFQTLAADQEGRHELLKRLGALSFDVLKEALKDSVMLVVAES